jgi:nitroreductase
MNLIESIKTASEIAERCQRNWDLSKTIPNEEIELLKTVIANSPSKQNEEFFSVLFITNRDTIEKIYQTTTYDGETPSDYNKNPQVLANLLVVFLEIIPNTVRNFGSLDLVEQEKNRNMAIGIASGELILTAAMLGLTSGFCLCFNPAEVKQVIGELPLLTIGLGYPDPTKERRTHHKVGKQFTTYDKTIKFKFI